VTKVNKASELIGMDVRNQQNERLGEIGDLVVDLESGKISYAVLSVGGFLGIGDRYIAVPPSAFHVAPDQDGLVLNADKSKIANAPGFAKSSWPDAKAEQWRTDAAYWLSDDDTARGTVGAYSSGAERGTRVNRSERSHEEKALEHRDSSPNRDASAATGRDGDTFSGRITAVDPESRTISVSGDSGTRQFKVADRAAITLKEHRNPRLVDLKVGYPVVVSHKGDVAHSITRSDAPEVR
jgi:sporulation protein YlmC with PRC-barrel domain